MAPGSHSIGSVLRIALVMLLLSIVLRSVRADDSSRALSDEDTEGAAARQEILRTLQSIQRQYGVDAVLMQGHLLGQAIHSGSILETTIAVSGVEERGGRRFLAFKLVTGIVYNDREVTPPDRPAHAWSDIVEPSLRKFQTVTVPADGVALLLEYAHKPYTDEADLRAHFTEGHGDPEAAAFYLLLGDVNEMAAKHIDAQQLLDRSVVLVNGTPAHIIPIPATPTPIVSPTP